MKKLFLALLALLAICGPTSVQAVMLDFNDLNNLGVNLGGGMMWNGTGGGHLYMESFDNDDFVIFFNPNTYVNGFQMNAKPWEGYVPWGLPNDWLVDIDARDANGNIIWSGQFDLANYQAWGDWLNINLNVAGVSRLVFHATGSLYPWEMGFWPSIDNMVINEQTPVPEPSSMLLLGSGLAALAGFRKRIIG